MMNERPDNAVEILRRAFDDLACAGRFADGPWISTFGDGPGEPYVPHRLRKVWGRLDDGRVVWAGAEAEGIGGG